MSAGGESRTRTKAEMVGEVGMVRVAGMAIGPAIDTEGGVKPALNRH